MNGIPENRFVKNRAGPARPVSSSRRPRPWNLQMQNTKQLHTVRHCWNKWRVEPADFHGMKVIEYACKWMLKVLEPLGKKLQMYKIGRLCRLVGRWVGRQARILFRSYLEGFSDEFSEQMSDLQYRSLKIKSRVKEKFLDSFFLFFQFQNKVL